jgi:hypothetical protein
MRDNDKDYFREVAQLTHAWLQAFKDLELPSDEQFLIWLRIHGDVEPILFAIGQTARRHAKSPLNPDHAIRFLSAAGNRYRFKRSPADRPSLPDAKFFAAKRAA